jgi:hypothetical protein
MALGLSRLALRLQAHWTNGIRELGFLLELGSDLPRHVSRRYVASRDTPPPPVLERSQLRPAF